MYSPQKGLFSDFSFKSNQRQAKFSILTLWCAAWLYAHCGDWLLSAMDTVEIVSSVRCTPWRLTPRCNAHRGDWHSGVLHIAEINFAVWCMHTSEIDCGMHNAEIDSTEIDSTEIDSRVGCTPRSFLKIWISWRNKKQQQLFSLYVKGLDGFESLKYIWRSKLLRHTPFNTVCTVYSIGLTWDQKWSGTNYWSVLYIYCILY